jgi:TIR domain
MEDFDARLGWYPIGNALAIIGPVAGSSAWQEMKSAIRHKALPARCLADGVTRDLVPHWLDFLAWNEPEGDVLWFDRDKARRKDVFVPNRAEKIVVAAVELSRLWPGTARGMSERTHEPLYDLVALASAQHGLPREQLLVRAFRAIVENELHVNIGTGLDERLPQGPTPRELIASSIRAIEGDPHFFAHWFKQIVVLRSDFDRWFRGTRDPYRALAEDDPSLRGASSPLLSERQLRPAPDAEIRTALTAKYDDAEKEIGKPPNVDEVVAPMKIFISCPSERLMQAREIYLFLSSFGIDVWFDKESLIVGQDWEREIAKAQRNADLIVLIYSIEVMNKTGIIQKELRSTIELAKIRPFDSLYLICIKVD